MRTMLVVSIALLATVILAAPTTALAVVGGGNLGSPVCVRTDASCDGAWVRAWYDNGNNIRVCVSTLVCDNLC